MQACVQLGGMSMSEADKVRKIIGKKKDAREFDVFQVIGLLVVLLSLLVLIEALDLMA
jgi:hypothetical protein